MVSGHLLSPGSTCWRALVYNKSESTDLLATWCLEGFYETNIIRLFFVFAADLHMDNKKVLSQGVCQLERVHPWAELVIRLVGHQVETGVFSFFDFDTM